MDLEAGEDDTALGLVLALFVFVAYLAGLVAFEEEYLAEALVGVDFGGERRGVADLKSDETFPFGFEGSDVDDDAAAGVGGLAQTDGDDITGDAEVLDRTGEGEGIGRDEASIAFIFDEGARVEMFGVDDGAVDVGEDFELVGDTDVIPVRGDAVADDTFADLAVGEGFDHFVLEGHAANPRIGLNRHPFLLQRKACTLKRIECR